MENPHRNQGFPGGVLHPETLQLLAASPSVKQDLVLTSPRAEPESSTVRQVPKITLYLLEGSTEKNLRAGQMKQKERQAVPAGAVVLVVGVVSPLLICIHSPSLT